MTDKAVTSRSKHRSRAVATYQREKFKLLNDISNILDPPTASVKTETPLLKNESPGPSVKTETPVLKKESELETNASKINSLQETQQDVLTINIPSCVKKVVLWKKGRNISMDV